MQAPSAWDLSAANTLSTKNCFFCNLRCCNTKRSTRLYSSCYVEKQNLKMSGSTSASDDSKKTTASAAVATTTAAVSQIPPAFSIDGLLGLKQQEAADKTTKEELQETATRSSSSTATTAQSSAAVAQASAGATHLVYSAAAAAAPTMVPSPALHGALWSSHPAASLAAFRCK